MAPSLSCYPAPIVRKAGNEELHVLTDAISALSEVVVIGAGPNGLVAANILAELGWQVTLLEANSEPGGAVRSGETIRPGFIQDRFSSFYPLAAISEPLRSLNLENFGLRWATSPAVLGHVFSDGRCVRVHRDLQDTVRSVESFGTGDGSAWRELFERWQRLGPTIAKALFSPLPSLPAGASLVAKLASRRELLSFARFVLAPVRTLAAELFTGEGAAMLLAGSTLHTDLSPEATRGSFYGWLIATAGQEHGFPVPMGGSGELTKALLRRGALTPTGENLDVTHASRESSCETVGQLE